MNLRSLWSHARDWIRRNPRLYRWGRLYFSRWYRPRTADAAYWRAILDRDPVLWAEQLSTSRGGTPVLLATGLGGEAAFTQMEGLLAAALVMRGARPHVLLCDSVLPACQLCVVSLYPRHEQFARHGPRQDLCRNCYSPAEQLFRTLGCDVHRYSDFVDAGDRARADEMAAGCDLTAIGAFALEGVAVGQHALAGALRFFARATLDGEPHGEAILRRYLAAAILATWATHRLIDRVPIESAVVAHGIYVPQGPVVEAARARGVRVTAWNVAYRKKSFLFSHGDTYHHTLMHEPTAEWEEMRWTRDTERRVRDYLSARWYGHQDWIQFQHRSPSLDPAADGIPIDPARPCIGLLTNVLWDAQLHYPANAFAGMLDWLVQTVRYFTRRPDLQLVIRVHPAEVTGAHPSRQLVVDELRKAFPQWPSNVFVVPPTSSTSTYALMERCDSVIIYGTKTGVELTAMGIPVIVAGEAWIRNKGLTLDAGSPAEYFALLDRLPLGRRLDPAIVQRARKYAFHFFFRRMIPLEFARPTGSWPPFVVEVDRVADLGPGRSQGLDIVCNGILEGTGYSYPAENDVGDGELGEAEAGTRDLVSR